METATSTPLMQKPLKDGVARSAEKNKPTLVGRAIRAYRRASGGSLLLSIGIHAVILGVGGYLVVSQVVEERKISFGGGDPGPKAEVQHKVKRRTTTAPAPNKRITTTSSVAKIALPDMPNVQLNMGPSIARAMGSGGFGSVGGLNGGGGGGGGGKGGFAKMTFFGLRGGKQGNLMKGIFYDLKQTPDRKPTNIGDGNPATGFNYCKEVQNFVLNKNWDPKYLEGKYYHSDVPLYSPRVYVPVDKSEEAPKAFGVDDMVKGDRWLVHYKGRFRAHRDGEFRFVGCGDNILVVRLNKQNIFDGSYSMTGPIDPKAKSSPPVKLGNASWGDWQLTAGKWFRVNQGALYEIEVIIGDCGGLFSAFLLFEEKGAKYAQRKDGSGLAYPLFQIDNSPMPPIRSPKNLEKFNPDVVVIPGIFEGTSPEGLF